MFENIKYTCLKFLTRFTKKEPYLGKILNVDLFKTLSLMYVMSKFQLLCSMGPHISHEVFLFAKRSLIQYQHEINYSLIGSLWLPL